MEIIYEFIERIKNKKQIIIIIFLFIIILFVVGYFVYINNFAVKNNEIEERNIFLKENNIETNEDKEDVKDCYVTVDVKGEVEKEGVYTLECGKRISDVLELAKVSKDGDTSFINLSKELQNEMVIIVDKYEEKKEKIKKDPIKNDARIIESEFKQTTVEVNKIKNTSSNNNSLSNVLNINNASLEELMKLSGIGEGKAKKIIEYRDINGSFKSIDELKNVSGIGEKMFEKIKDFITV